MKVSALATCNSRSAGGLYYTIPSFCKELKARGCDVSVISYDDRFSLEDKGIYGDVAMLPYTTSKVPLLRQFGYSNNLYEVIMNYRPDIVHQQGIWMYHSVVAKKYRKANPNSRLIIEPHGMLDPWAVKNSHWKKKLAGFCFENDNLRSADCIHALCHSEYISIRSYGLKNPVAIIPNGIYLPEADSMKRLERKCKTLLAICRLHPKKGLLELIQALGLLKARHSDFMLRWKLRIAGWDQCGFVNRLIGLVNDLNLTDCVEFIGSVYGERKECELKSADAFILPSYSEGLPMSILEAWSYGLPVVMTDACNLPEGFDASAALRTTTVPNDIADALERLDAMSVDQLSCMGNNGLDLVRNKFTWVAVAKDTELLYKWLLGTGEKPDFVYTD